LHCMRHYFLLPYRGIGNEHMKKLLFIIIAGTAFSCAAFAQTQRQISNILRDQQQWKNKQLPANSVLQNFGSTAIYAAATLMEREKQKRKTLPAIAMPQPAKQKAMLPMGERTDSKQWQYSTASLHMQTSFMQWLSNYLPPKNIR
jgi:hypothetical protein